MECLKESNRVVKSLYIINDWDHNGRERERESRT